MKEVIIASAVRTAIGDFGGSLADISPCDMGAAVASEAISRAGLDSARVGQTVFVHVIATAPEEMRGLTSMPSGVCQMKVSGSALSSPSARERHFSCRGVSNMVAISAYSAFSSSGRTTNRSPTRP